MTIILYIYTSNAWGIGGIRPSLEIQPPQLYDPIPRGKNPRIWRFFCGTKGVSYYPLCADHNGIMHELRIHITNHYISIYLYIYIWFFNRILTLHDTAIQKLVRNVTQKTIKIWVNRLVRYFSTLIFCHQW